MLQASFFQPFTFFTFPIIVCIGGAIDICRDAEFLTRVSQLAMGKEHASQEEQRNKKSNLCHGLVYFPCSSAKIRNHLDNAKTFSLFVYISIH